MKRKRVQEQCPRSTLDARNLSVVLAGAGALYWLIASQGNLQLPYPKEIGLLSAGLAGGVLFISSAC